MSTIHSKNDDNHSRRDFIKQLSLASGAILASPVLSRCAPDYENELYSRFLEPTTEAKPFFRWWWNGNHLSKDEITRQLELMHDAGIGGIEINPIEMPEHASEVEGDVVVRESIESDELSAAARE